MAIQLKTVGRSVLESMLFLAVLGTSYGLFNVLPFFNFEEGSSVMVAIPFMTMAASAVVAAAFPKPSFKRAFLKYFLGGLLTFGIFSLMTIALGPVIFTLVLDWLWDTGANVWNWSSPSGIVAGIFAVFAYIMLTIVLVGMVFAGLFALTNFLVLLAINVITERKRAQEDGTQP